MAYYDALVSAWNAGAVPSGVTGAPLAGTTPQKLALLNAWTVAGPPQDIPMASVVAYLALNGKLAGLQAYAASAASGATFLTQAQVAARELVALMSVPSITAFEMSNPAIYAGVSGFLTALAGDSVSGITSADVSNLMAMSATAKPWWQAQGYGGPLNANDLDAAGLS